jgi:hypothetical protein
MRSGRLGKEIGGRRRQEIPPDPPFKKGGMIGAQAEFGQEYGVPKLELGNEE